MCNISSVAGAGQGKGFRTMAAITALLLGRVRVELSFRLGSSSVFCFDVFVFVCSRISSSGFIFVCSVVITLAYICTESMILFDY